MPTTGDRVVNFIRSYTDENGYAPTYRDIQEGAKLSSTSHVAYWLKILESAGRITRKTNSPRTIRVVSDD